MKVDILESMQGATLSYSNSLRKDNYIVETADILEPSDYVDYDPILFFPESGKKAGLIVDSEKGTVAILSIPFETFLDRQEAARLMTAILRDIE